jgi:hypothetical protein
MGQLVGGRHTFEPAKVFAADGGYAPISVAAPELNQSFHKEVD